MKTKMEAFRGHFATPSQKPSPGRAGWIWGGFSEGFGGIWEPWGVQMDMKINTFRRKSRPFPQDPPREALGRVLGGFGEVWGRFWEGFGRILRGFFNKLANPSES